MKNYILSIFLVLLCSGKSHCQSRNSTSVGFKISKVQDDFRLGLDVISPYFVHNKIAVRFSANNSWFEHILEGISTWTPYQSIQLSMRSRQFVIDDKLFIYGDGGLMFLFPNDDFSSKNLALGGYGLVGVEFKSSNLNAFYLEMGGMGNSVRADNIPTSPSFSNRFITNTGFRFYL